jgi:hypothetical protein
MIQRIQSVWLLLAAACGFLTTEAPIFSARLANNTAYNLMANSSLLLFAILMGAACVSLIAIFLFKKRPVQLRLCVIGILLAVIAIALQVRDVEQYKSATAGLVSGTWQWGGLLPILMIIFFILAARGIYKDQKLVKSLDRLR